MKNIFRGTVTAAKDRMMRALQILLRGEETRDNLEHMEPYGFTSEPFTDGATDALVVFLDEDKSHGIVVNVADRRYRIQNLEQGEVCIYDDLKRKVYLRREGILIDGVDSPIVAVTSDSISATAGKTVSVVAGENIYLNASGNINIEAGGEVTIKGSKVNLN